MPADFAPTNGALLPIKKPRIFVRGFCCPTWIKLGADCQMVVGGSGTFQFPSKELILTTTTNCQPKEFPV
jgi:hypothetical protein